MAGSNPRLDSAIKSRAGIMRFLCQGARDVSTVDDTMRQMEALAGMVGAGAA